MKRQRQRFRRTVRHWEVGHFKFLDESSVNVDLTRRYGRGTPGQRVVESTPLPSGPHTTTLAVVGLAGISAPLVRSGAVTGDFFYHYLQQCVAPSLQPGDVLFLDNLSTHKVAGLEQLIQARGARLLYLPPYSADFNPIEWAWAKVKTLLRRLKARTFDELVEALRQALRAITLEDIQGWFAHCGYPIR